MSPRPHSVIIPGCFIESSVNITGVKVPLGSKTKLEQIPLGYGGCLQAVMVSPILMGEQRDNCQRMCSGASDASSIGGCRSFPDRMESSAQRAWKAWPRGSPGYHCTGAMGNTAMLRVFTSYNFNKSAKDV